MDLERRSAELERVAEEQKPSDKQVGAYLGFRIHKQPGVWVTRSIFGLEFDRVFLVFRLLHGP